MLMYVNWNTHSASNDYILFTICSFINFHALVNFVILSLIKDLRVHKIGA